MSTTILQRMRLVNGNLRAALVRLQDAEKHRRLIAPTEFTDLLAELHQATDSLRTRPVTSSPDEDMDREVSQYKAHLVKLRELLPSAYGRFLIEKARLENARAHVARAAAWTQAREKTL